MLTQEIPISSDLSFQPLFFETFLPLFQERFHPLFSIVLCVFLS